jgi:uncharacterized protein with GYD domain
MQNPQDRLEAVRAPIEKLRGKLHASFFASGDFDVLAITEMLDTISAAAISMAFAGGGAISKINTTALLTAAQALEASRKAGSSGYKSITSECAAGTSAGRCSTPTRTPRGPGEACIRPFSLVNRLTNMLAPLTRYIPYGI